MTTKVELTQLYTKQAHLAVEPVILHTFLCCYVVHLHSAVCTLYTQTSLLALAGRFAV